MNYEQIYRFLAISCINITFIFGLCFLLLKVPTNESLKGYRISRKVMAIAYFFVGVLNIIEIHFIAVNPNVCFSALVTLIVAAFQAILFTFTLLALINFEFISKLRIYRELLPVLLFSIATFISFFADFQHLFKPIYYIFILYYTSLIIRFSILFFKQYHSYLQKLENFFSIQESNKLRWVRTAFFISLTIGLMALISLYFNGNFPILFNIISIAFFIYFGIRFLNYVYIFKEIETAIVVHDKHVPKEGKDFSFSFDQLENAIEQWEQKKLFTCSSVTIEKVAVEIKTNRTYLSNYINTYKKMTFNEWINRLRVEEAKSLMINNPDMPVSQIGVMIGLADKSNFGRQFLKMTGLTPLAWKSKQFNK